MVSVALMTTMVGVASIVQVGGFLFFGECLPLVDALRTTEPNRLAVPIGPTAIVFYWLAHDRAVGVDRGDCRFAGGRIVIRRRSCRSATG